MYSTSPACDARRTTATDLAVVRTGVATVTTRGGAGAASGVMAVRSGAAEPSGRRRPSPLVHVYGSAWVRRRTWFDGVRQRPPRVSGTSRFVDRCRWRSVRSPHLCAAVPYSRPTARAAALGTGEHM